MLTFKSFALRNFRMSRKSVKTFYKVLLRGMKIILVNTVFSFYMVIPDCFPLHSGRTTLYENIIPFQATISVSFNKRGTLCLLISYDVMSKL